MRQALLVGAAQLGRSGRRTGCAARPAPLRVRASAPARSAGRPAPRRRRARPARRCSCSAACALAATCCGGGLDARAAARRAAPPACARWNCASCAWRSSARCCSRAAASARSAAITASSSSAWRSCVVAELHVELLEARLAGGAAFGQRLELGVDLGQLLVELAAARLRGLGLLRQAQQLDLQLVRAGLRLGRPRGARWQPLRGVGVGRLAAHQRAARLVGDQRLCALLALEVLDLLRARQHAGLLGVGRVEGHGELRHRMALAGHDDFAVRQLAARWPAPRRGSAAV